MDTDSLSSSLLTPTQREYLRQDNGEGIETGSAYDRAIRAKIRERLKAGLHDFALLSRQLESRDRKRILADVDDTDSSPTYLNFVDDILRFIFVGLLDSETATQEFDSPEELFNHLIGTAIESSFPEQGLHVDGVTVELTVKGVSGTIQPGEIEEFDFAGEIEDITLDPRDGAVVRIDGKEVDPATLGGDRDEEDDSDDTESLF